MKKKIEIPENCHAVTVWTRESATHTGRIDYPVEKLETIEETNPEKKARFWRGEVKRKDDAINVLCRKLAEVCEQDEKKRPEVKKLIADLTAEISNEYSSTLDHASKEIEAARYLITQSTSINTAMEKRMNDAELENKVSKRFIDGSKRILFDMWYKVESGEYGSRSPFGDTALDLRTALFYSDIEFTPEYEEWKKRFKSSTENTKEGNSEGAAR